MESGSRIFLESGDGREIDARLQAAARRLEGRACAWRKQELNDESMALHLLEEAAWATSERNGGEPIKNPEAYIWESFRHSANRAIEIRERIVNVESVDLERRPAEWGSPEEIEKAILIQQLLHLMEPRLRRIWINLLVGRSHEEIAEAEGITVAALETRLSRRMKEFVKRLSSKGDRS